MPKDYSWKMGDYQKKIGIQKLKNIDENLDHRNKITALYDEGLKSKKRSIANRNGDTNLLRYPVLVANKDELLEKAKKEHIELGSWFETPLHPIPLSEHKFFNYKMGQCLNAERDARRVINLPLHEQVTIGDAEKILAFILQNAIPIND